MNHQNILHGVIMRRSTTEQSQPSESRLPRFGRTGAWVWAGALFGLSLLTSCTDNRKAPTETSPPAYTSTKVLLNRQAAAGQSLTANFSLRDSVTAGQIMISGWLRPDAGLTLFTDIGKQLDSLASRILQLDGAKLNIEIQPVKTHADSVSMDSLQVLINASNNEVAIRNTRRDSLDTWLDDRFKVSIMLDGDAVPLYPRAILLDSIAVPHQIPTGLDTTLIWGQGFYTAPPSDTLGTRGRTMRLDLNRFLIADVGYHNPTKPARPADSNTLPELFPITDWLRRLTPGNHSLHIRFGAAGTTSEVEVVLYVIYKTAG